MLRPHISLNLIILWKNLIKLVEKLIKLSQKILMNLIKLCEIADDEGTSCEIVSGL